MRSSQRPPNSYSHSLSAPERVQMCPIFPQTWPWVQEVT